MKTYESESMKTKLDYLIFPLLHNMEIIKTFDREKIFNDKERTEKGAFFILLDSVKKNYIINLVELFVGWNSINDSRITHSLLKLVNQLIKNYLLCQTQVGTT